MGLPESKELKKNNYRGEMVRWPSRSYLQPGLMAWVEVQLLAQVPQVFCQPLFLLLLQLPVLLTGP